MLVMAKCVTHNFDPDGIFLGNVCNLPPTDAAAVLQLIRKSGRRTIRRNYLARRYKTEDWLTGARKTLLGETPLKRPIYFFLGDYSDGRNSSRPCSIVMPVSAFPPNTITFTYPDSMTSFSSRGEDGVAHYPYGEVFSFEQIVSVIDEFGLPGERSPSPLAHYECYIEMQAWDDRPILAFLASNG